MAGINLGLAEALMFMWSPILPLLQTIKFSSIFEITLSIYWKWKFLWGLLLCTSTSAWFGACNACRPISALAKIILQCPMISRKDCCKRTSWKCGANSAWRNTSTSSDAVGGNRSGTDPSSSSSKYWAPWIPLSSISTLKIAIILGYAASAIMIMVTSR